MDWKIFIGTFGLVFLAELGDKTQLTALAFSAGSRSTWSIFIGASAALVLSTLIAVLLGSFLNQQTLVPLNAIKIASGILFLLFGVLIIRDGLAGKAAPAQVAGQEIVRPGILIKTALSAAANFEEATGAYYLTAANAAADPAVKALFTRLASEEQQHIRKIRNLFAAHADQPISSELDTDLASRPAEITDQSDQSLLKHFIKTEHDTVAFYQELAAKALLPSLKNTFAKLAEEELRHEQMLIQQAGMLSDQKA